MFPNANHLPPGLSEPPGLSLVAISVLFEFRQPVVRIGLWERCMPWTAMPEAPIDEHQNS
jgi:hypothetical protein